VPAALFLVAFLLRLLAISAVSGDEPLWLSRASHYIDAYTSLDLRHATSISTGGGTMPGITVVAVGGAAKIVWSVLNFLGFDTGGHSFVTSPVALSLAHVFIALVNGLLVVALWWVIRAWSNSRVALVATTIVATEPFLALHGARFTTDSFVMMFGAIGTIGLAAALGIPKPIHDLTRRRVTAIVAGAALACACMSKLSFLASVPFLIALVAIAIALRDRGLSGRDIAGVLLMAGMTALAVTMILWPALWTDFGGQLAVMRNSADQVGIERQQFFFGAATAHPGPFFYPVVMAMLATPWLFLLGLATPIAVRARRTRPYAVLMLAYCVVPFLAITLASLKYDRYSLPLWPAGAVLAALVVDLATTELAWRLPRSRALVGIAVLLGVALVTVTALEIGNDAAVYANPLLGGGATAQDVILIGGPEASQAGQVIAARQHGDCKGLHVFTPMPRGPLEFPCGHVVTTTAELHAGDYIVLDEGSIRRKLVHPAPYRAMGDVVAHVRRRGIDLAYVIQVR
jgi:hypothetical protein